MFGLVAAAIPLVLHLISKREPKSMPFPAVRFLTSSYQSNRSRLQVRRWWLLAMRMLAIAAVAVTLARPAIARNLSTTWLSIGIVAALAVALLVMAAVTYSTGQSKKLSLGLLASSIAAFVVSLGWGGVTAARGPTLNLDAQAPAAIAIVIDNSPTSAWEQDTQSLLQRHKTIAIELLSRLAPSSRVAIIDRGPEPASFSIDLSGAIAKVESLATRDIATPMASRLDAALRLVRTSELENRQVFVVTDLAESTWAKEPGALQGSILGAESPVAVTVIDPIEFRGLNRRLGVPRVSDQTPPRQTPTPVAMVVSVDSVGETDSPTDALLPKETSVTVEMMIFETDPSLPVIRNGELVLPKTQSVDRTSARLSPGQSSEIVLRIPPLDEGTHHGLIRLVGDDAFPTDNERYFTVSVQRSTSILIVGDVPDETLLIAKVVAAPFAWDDPNAEFKIDRISDQDVLATRLEEYAAVVLLNPPADLLAESVLTEYVTRGGGVFACLGPAIMEPPGGESTAINSQLVPTLVRKWRVPDPGTYFQTTRASHPVLSPLEIVTGGVPWNQFPVTQYWQLDVAEGDTVLMSYASTNHVALVERHLNPGKEGGTAFGHCIVMSTPLPALAGSAKTWNQLFGSDPWPAFALVRQVIGYVSGRDSDPTTTTVGKPNIVSLDLTDDAMDGTETERLQRRLQLFSPNREQAVPIDLDASSDKVLVAEVLYRGAYWLRGDGVASGFSANLPEDSAITRRVDPSKLDEWFGTGNYSLVHNASEIDFTRGGQTQSILLQSPAMLFALVVFLLEQVLSNRFYQSSVSKPTRSTRKGMSPA